ncbi:hypothetical protein EYF80_041098 [Liparis tanakae]|uniref:Uncharacterized protein n=1 Tax=Liparis tanakae TaxID=230148 RepID=A0A4Z2G6F9_9TELE|nr:hypothetical protein EYF80_041098 [Liparis tanakae]
MQHQVRRVATRGHCCSRNSADPQESLRGINRCADELESLSKAESKLKGEKKRKEREMSAHRPPLKLNAAFDSPPPPPPPPRWQRTLGPSFSQRVGGSIPARVAVPSSKTLDPELLPVSM